MTSNAAVRTSALRISQAREYTMDRLVEQQLYDFDVTGIARELAALEDRYFEFTAEEWEDLIGPHQYDANGTTDAELAKALARNGIRWAAMLRDEDGTAQTWKLTEAFNGKTESEVEATLRTYIEFPEGSSLMILPLVG